MPMRSRGKAAVYNTPTIRNGGFGYLQVEAIHNRPMSIARRHLAASELRMRSIEPNELTSGEWVRFLVMETSERERWISDFERKRRNSNESTSSVDADRETAVDKAEEARLEAEEAAREERRAPDVPSSPPPPPSSSIPVSAVGAAGLATSAAMTPSVSIWARQFDEDNDNNNTAEFSARRPRHVRRAVTESIIEAPPPPTYETAVRSRTPPPAYEPRGDDDNPTSPPPPRHVRFAV